MNTIQTLSLCTICMLMLVACQPSTVPESFIRTDRVHDIPIFKGPDVIMDDFRAGLVQAWEAEEPVRVVTGPTLGEGWQYGQGDPARGLMVGIQDRPAMDTLVTLPHRILKPNWPLWYERVIAAGPGDRLYVNADDGAQVFQDGQLLASEVGEFYEVLPSEGASTFTIRVLNNAVRGGLRDVRLVEKEAYQPFISQRMHWVDRNRILFEAMRVDSLSEEQKAATKALLAQPSTQTITVAQSLFEPTLEYPFLPDQALESSGKGRFGFTAWGDSQAGWDTFQLLVGDMATDSGIDFSIGLGDLVGYGSQEEQWLAFTASLQPLIKKHPVYLVAGNHDYDGYYNTLSPELYYQYTRKQRPDHAYFSWVHDGAFFLALDPNHSFPLGFDHAQVAWMQMQMESQEWKAANWRFVLIHQAPYAQGWPEYHGDEFIQELIDSLAVPKKIDFVLTGHNHDYERLTMDYGAQRTHFLILGGAGGGLEPEESSAFPEMDRIIKKHHYARFDVRPDTVSVSIWGVKEELLDEVLVTR